MIKFCIALVMALAIFVGGLATSGSSQELLTPATVETQIRKAVSYYRENVAVRGGYVYHYSEDLQQRWGEGLASPEQIWVQPPGTPTVGMAYLKVFAATGDQFYLEAARESANALIYGQLSSGGWRNAIDMSGKKKGQIYSGGRQREAGRTSLDDGQTQSAILFLIQMDRALEFEDQWIHEATLFALDRLLAAQFPNGGFPQGWKKTLPNPDVIAASFPDYDWRTEGRIKNYWDLYTLNDNVCGYVAETLIAAYKVYGDQKYKTALERLGEFLILAQMPEPQPAWAQQYDYQMYPVWARKFEPPAIAGDETQEAIETLMKISIATENPKFLVPIPSAIAYLKRSLLSDGRLARFYELKTNRPLYMVRPDRSTYLLTYDDSNLPAHYRWKWNSRIDQLDAQYQLLLLGKSIPESRRRNRHKLTADILDALDEQGRWVSQYNGQSLVGQAKFAVGSRFLSSAVFSQNLSVLAEYLKETRHSKEHLK